LSIDLLSDKVIGLIWQRMLSIYGHKWVSHLGVADDGEGELTDSAKTWKKGLAGITVEQVKHGFDVLIFKSHDWPPSLPEFRKLCLSKSVLDIPSLDQAIKMLVSIPYRTGSLANRYQHPLILAISSEIDMFALRTASTLEAKRMVKPIYEKLLDTGWKDWPDHAHKEQNCIENHKPRSSKDFALSALSVIKGGL
jgi:hypothetical protein